MRDSKCIFSRNKAQEAEALAREAYDESENSLKESKDAVDASWDKTKNVLSETGERFAKSLIHAKITDFTRLSKIFNFSAENR